MATIESLVVEQQENDKQLNKDAEEYKKKLEDYFVESYGPELLNYFTVKNELYSKGKNMYQMIDGIKISGFEYSYEGLDTDNPIYKINYNKVIFIVYKANDDIFEFDYANKDILTQLGLFEKMISELERANFLRWEEIIRNNLEKKNSSLVRNRKDISDKMELLDGKIKARYIKR